MLKFTIHKASELDRNVKATVQSTGKLGFSDTAAKKLALEVGKYLVIASNEIDETDENFYAWIENEAEGGGFKVNKAGEYFNVNTKPLFDKLDINYRDKENVIIFDIVEFEHEGNKIFKLIKRIQKRSRNKKTGEAGN